MNLPHTKLSNHFLFFTKHKIWPSVWILSQLSNLILSLVLYSCVLPDHLASCPGHITCSDLHGGPPTISPSALRYSFLQLLGMLADDGFHISLSGDFSQMKETASLKIHTPSQRQPTSNRFLETYCPVSRQDNSKKSSQLQNNSWDVWGFSFLCCIVVPHLLLLILLPSLPNRGWFKGHFLVHFWMLNTISESASWGTWHKTHPVGPWAFPIPWETWSCCFFHPEYFLYNPLLVKNLLIVHGLSRISPIPSSFPWFRNMEALALPLNSSLMTPFSYFCYGAIVAGRLQGKSLGFGVKHTWTPPLSSLVIMDSSVFLINKIRDGGVYFISLLWTLNEITQIKCLAHSRCSSLRFFNTLLSSLLYYILYLYWLKKPFVDLSHQPMGLARLEYASLIFVFIWCLAQRAS